jgi:hypothetical protein
MENWGQRDRYKFHRQRWLMKGYDLALLENQGIGKRAVAVPVAPGRFMTSAG